MRPSGGPLRKALAAMKRRNKGLSSATLSSQRLSPSANAHSPANGRNRKNARVEQIVGRGGTHPFGEATAPLTQG
jgi:hypothetical protein